ncbi:MAG: MBL fold metallo-hydrolase [Chloroflexi bacterium]|nr:MBL fold metallo-hydrolase [Chloroflexota bacterium]
MAQLTILGSSNAIPSLEHENSHLAVATAERVILVDCASNPVVRLERAGVDIHAVTDIILTQFHPDHVAGLPLLLMDMWLMGRRPQLNIYGLSYTLDRVESMMALYGWGEWPDFFTVNFFRIPASELALVLETTELRVLSSPATHFLPNIGLRFEFKAGKKSFAYSCDTEPSQAILELARGVDILLHEATGSTKGHSSAAQAGDVAREAQAGALYLIHYPTGKYASGDPVAEARARFPREVVLAIDFMKIDLD